ncbi:MAG: hypothetical protein ACP5HQ_06995 [Thermoprotei archaeon]
MKWLGSLLLAIGVTLIGASFATISASSAFTYSFGDYVNFEIPGFVGSAMLEVYLNSTNVTGYVKIIEPNGHAYSSRLPTTVYLYPGNWTVELVSETVQVVKTVVINETVATNCSNVTTQRVVSVPTLVNVSKPVVNATAKLHVLSAYPVGNPVLVRAVGFVFAATGAGLYLTNLVKSRLKSK